MALLRIDKIIADCGAASRKEAAALIKRGSVLANGVRVKSPSDKFDPDSDEISVNGQMLSYKKFRYIMMNKPSGYISSTEDAREKTVIELLDDGLKKQKLFPAGRLDKDAVGLLILTNDGEYAHNVISPNKKVDKRYYVRVDGVLTQNDCRSFESGIVLKDGLECRPAKLSILSDNEGYVRIHEGKYHQVKRMLASLGKPVLYLKRCTIGSLQLDESLQPGEYREMTEEERLAVFVPEKANEK
jgi:16S rRNA pseudouridine516 synthase